MGDPWPIAGVGAWGGSVNTASKEGRAQPPSPFSDQVLCTEPSVIGLCTRETKTAASAAEKRATSNNL